MGSDIRRPCGDYSRQTSIGGAGLIPMVKRSTVITDMRTMMTPPPTSVVFKKAGLKPKSLAAQSITTASNSVHAGLLNHYPITEPSGDSGSEKKA
jgi:hypothetical protein